MAAGRRERRSQARCCAQCAGAEQRLPPRRWCCFYLRMGDAPGFDLVPMIIGRQGRNTRSIAEQTGAKVRVRGHGSGHLELSSGREAPAPLMLVVATESENRRGFHLAVDRAAELLRQVEVRYVKHCQAAGLVANTPAFTLGPLSDVLFEELKAACRTELPPRSEAPQHTQAGGGTAAKHDNCRSATMRLRT